MIVAPLRLREVIGEAMNVLNGIAERFPDALSLAAGRPALAHVELTQLDEAVARFVAHTGRAAGPYQYGPTPGLLRELIAAAVGVDEAIEVDPGRVLMTAGAQEAMFLVLHSLFDPRRDVLLVPDPSYVGITGAAARAGVSIASVPAERLDATRVAEVAAAVESRGLRPRALYLVPDHPNPTGSTLREAERRALIELARRLDLWLVEDSPYRAFSFEPPPPSLLALAPDRVIHLGSLAKVLSPGLRLGYLIWPAASQARWLDLIQAKSFVSLATSPLAQAIAGGLLLAQDRPSLRAYAAPARATYRARRDALLDALARELGGYEGVSWQTPRGGFFITMALPFDVDFAQMRRWASDHGVIVCPMTLFSPTGRGRDQIRLAYASLAPAQLAEAAGRLRAAIGGAR
jgi:(S)-3,5-dihydroxyphenylglycine transaminase